MLLELAEDELDQSILDEDRTQLTLDRHLLKNSHTEAQVDRGGDWVRRVPLRPRNLAHQLDQVAEHFFAVAHEIEHALQCACYDADEAEYGMN